MGIHHIGGEASRGLRHPHGHSNEQYKRRGDRELEREDDEKQPTGPLKCSADGTTCLKN